MKYLSTRNSNLDLSFFEILFQGLSKDGGLFLPHEWPALDINSLKGKTYEELAIEVIHPYVSVEISKNDLKKIIDESYKNFSNPKIAPVTTIDQNKYILELFYGPTFAFKDYALQFLGNLFTYALPKASKKLTVLDGSLQSKERDVPEYIQLDDKNKTAKLVRIPKFSEVPFPVIMEPSLVIEYYSR